VESIGLELLEGGMLQRILMVFSLILGRRMLMDADKAQDLKDLPPYMILTFLAAT
jgi:hypothetical protein